MLARVRARHEFRHILDLTAVELVSCRLYSVRGACASQILCSILDQTPKTLGCSVHRVVSALSVRELWAPE
ncbi:hypothetical protein N7468_006684 [Penicillium chermesinum]|uniref:Uncharacterized protein n=1 Tax=Penicillium chermesinum TaxID=63820 RepID=A0A9W9NVH4_9EURO|nr:uncharacterized protein N7468_006684 [Penicillium chermesinum]KAJ5225459.1 hypothetical protein N7468_006684 [Penicillium chermesinum]